MKKFLVLALALSVMDYSDRSDGFRTFSGFDPQLAWLALRRPGTSEHNSKPSPQAESSAP